VSLGEQGRSDPSTVYGLAYAGSRCGFLPLLTAGLRSLNYSPHSHASPSSAQGADLLVSPTG